MNKLIAIFIVIMLPLPAFAAFGAKSAWDVRTTGVDTNGGAFDSGVASPGTDESQGGGAAISVTLAGTGTTGTGSPAFTATTHGPGNFINIASGAGCTVGWYEILSQSSGTATFDRSMGTAASVCTGTIGGSLLTIGQSATNAVTGNTIWLQSGTYTLTATVIFTQASLVLNGYASAHGDNGTKPLITTSTNTTPLLETNTAGTGIQQFVNLALSNTATTRADGIFSFQHGTNETWLFKNTTWTGFADAIDNSNGAGVSDVFTAYIINSQFTNNSAGYVSGTNPKTYVTGSTFTMATGANGISSGGPFFYLGDSTFSCTVSCNIVINTAGGNNIIQRVSENGGGTAATIGLDLASGTSLVIVLDSIFYGNATGILLNGTLAPPAIGGIAAIAGSGCNAYGNNTSDVSNWVKASTDVNLTANPYTSTTNFALNSTAGGGAALKQKGCPGIFPGGATTGFPDIGAVQSAGGGTTTINNFGVSN